MKIKSDIMSGLLVFAMILGFSLSDLGNLLGLGGSSSTSTASATSTVPPNGTTDQRTRAILGKDSDPGTPQN